MLRFLVDAERLALPADGADDDVRRLNRVAELGDRHIVETAKAAEDLVVGDLSGVRVSEPVPGHRVIAHDDVAELTEPARVQAAHRQVAGDDVILGVRVDAEGEGAKAWRAVDPATAALVVDIAPDDAAVEDDP